TSKPPHPTSSQFFTSVYQSIHSCPTQRTDGTFWNPPSPARPGTCHAPSACRQASRQALRLPSEEVRATVSVSTGARHSSPPGKQTHTPTHTHTKHFHTHTITQQHICTYIQRQTHSTGY